MTGRTDKFPLVRQTMPSDCGVACLLSILRYYGGNTAAENIRIASGTTARGTTLLGLYQTALKLGFHAEGAIADKHLLYSLKDPLILHLRMEEQHYHYVIFLGTRQVKGETLFVIGDPAKGIVLFTGEELEKNWPSKYCLTLTPNEQFTKVPVNKNEKLVWLKEFIRGDSSLLFSAAVIGVFISVLGLAMAIFSEKLIDEILPQKSWSKLYIGITAVSLLLVIKELLTFIRQQFLLRQSRMFNIRIIDHFFTHLLRLPKPFFDSRKIGELTARMNDTSRIQRVISQLAGASVIDALVIIITFAGLFYYSWQVALACLIMLPLFFVLVRRYTRKIVKGQRNIMGDYAMSEANFIATLQGIDLIRNYHRQEQFASANTEIYRKFQHSILDLGGTQARLTFAANFAGIIFLMGILTYCSTASMGGQIKPGTLMAVLSLCSALLPGVANLALVSIPIQEAKIALERMFDFTTVPVENAGGSVEIETVDRISFEKLTFRYPGRGLLLKDVSLVADKGEVIAIMGENGCGKSTLLQLLQRHYSHESGSIILNANTLLQDTSLASWRKLVGVVPQEIPIFNASILANIILGDTAGHEAQFLQFIDELGFGPFLSSFADSYMTLIGEGGINLSGGQKQLIAFMRALYHQPAVLILDEATSAMDREAEKIVFNAIRQLKARMITILITHRLHSIKNICDRMYILESGRIIGAGNHQTVLKGDNLYSRYWNELST